MTRLSPEQLTAYINELYHRRRQLHPDDSRRDWYDTAIDNAKLLQEERKLPQQKQLPMDNQSRKRYLHDRLRFITEYAEAHPTGFTLIEIMEAFTEQVEDDRLIVHKSTFLGDLADLARDGVLTASQNLERKQYTYYYTGDSE